MNYPKLRGRLRKISISWIKEKGSNTNAGSVSTVSAPVHAKLHSVTIVSHRGLIHAPYLVPLLCSLCSFLITVFWFGAFWDKSHHVVLTGLEFSMLIRLASNLLQSCFSFPSARMTGMSYYTQYCAVLTTLIFNGLVFLQVNTSQGIYWATFFSMYLCICRFTCVYMWKLEGNLGCHPQEYNPLLLSQRLSLTWSFHLDVASWPVNPRDTPFSVSPVLWLWIHAWLFYAMPRQQTQVFMLAT